MTLIETMAKAIVAQVYKETDGDVSGWDRLDEESRGQARRTARAALAAAREPTEAMRDVGTVEFHRVYTREPIALNVWQAMIDAALEEGK